MFVSEGQCLFVILMTVENPVPRTIVSAWRVYVGERGVADGGGLLFVPGFGSQSILRTWKLPPAGGGERPADPGIIFTWVSKS